MAAANSRPNGRRGNGSNGAPPWARELSADVRAMILEMREDRKRADERDARHAAEMAAFARRAEEDRARHHKELVRVLAGATRVGIQIRQDIQQLGDSMRRDIHAIREDIRALTHSIDGLVRVLHSRGNGRGNGNGRRVKP